MKNQVLFLAGLFILFIVFSACDKGEPVGPEDTDINTNADVVWKSKLAVAINPALGMNYMPAVDENDNIYVMMVNWENGGIGYALQAFDKNGNEIWKKEESSANLVPHRQLVSYYKGKLYYTFEKKLVCLNAANGTEAWSYTVPDTLRLNYNIAISNNQILANMMGFTAEYSHLFTFDPDNGNVISTLALGGRNEIYAMAANGNTAYLTYNKLYSINVGSNGLNINWEKVLPGNIDAYDETYTNMFNDIAIDPTSGNIVFTYENIRAIDENWLIAYSPNGTKLWEADYPSTHLTIDNVGSVYSSDIKLYKLNGQNGNKIWEATPPSETFGIGNSISAVVYGNDDVMYCGDYFGLYGINNESQEKFSKFPSSISGDETPLSFATLLCNGNIIVLGMKADNDTHARIYCIKGSSNGIKQNIWAKWGGNAANTFNLVSN